MLGLSLSPPLNLSRLLRATGTEWSQDMTEINNAGKTETKTRIHLKPKSLRCKIAIPFTPLVILNELDKMFLTIHCSIH